MRKKRCETVADWCGRFTDCNVIMLFLSDALVYEGVPSITAKTEFMNYKVVDVHLSQSTNTVIIDIMEGFL